MCRRFRSRTRGRNRPHRAPSSRLSAATLALGRMHHGERRQPVGSRHWTASCHFALHRCDLLGRQGGAVHARHHAVPGARGAAAMPLFFVVLAVTAILLSRVCSPGSSTGCRGCRLFRLTMLATLALARWPCARCSSSTCPPSTSSCWPAPMSTTSSPTSCSGWSPLPTSTSFELRRATAFAACRAGRGRRRRRSARRHAFAARAARGSAARCCRRSAC